MTKYDVTWKLATSVGDKDSALACRQVYVWIMTDDERVVIVSKDGDNWQLPGGKPEIDETLIETAIREVHEETGLDIAEHAQDLQMFGYYVVTELSVVPLRYLQVRYSLRLSQSASSLSLSVDGEDNNQSNSDAIKFVQAVPLVELTHYIPWMSSSEEYRYIENNP